MKVIRFSNEEVMGSMSQVIKRLEISLSSEAELSSTNTCDHIDWLFDKLKDKEDAVKMLQSNGCRIAIGCFWLSKNGRGGPILEIKQISELAKFNIPIGWDVSFEK